MPAQRYFLLLCITALAITVTLWSQLGQRDIILDLLEGISTLSTCASCLAILIPLKSLAELGDGAFTRVLVDICIQVGVSTCYSTEAWFLNMGL